MKTGVSVEIQWLAAVIFRPDSGKMTVIAECLDFNLNFRMAMLILLLNGKRPQIKPGTGGDDAPMPRYSLYS
jgi:hypothetical protein